MYIRLHVTYTVFLSDFNEIFEKYSNIKFHENPSSRSRVAPCGRTDGRADRQDEANSHFSQFGDRAYKSTIVHYIKIQSQ